MPKKIEVGIIGLGKFGYALAEALRELGHDVVGIDADMDKIDRAQSVLTHAYQADGTDKNALRQTGIHEMDYVAVSIGNSIGTSILVTLNLLELGVDKTWVKAVSEEHQRVLSKLGVDYVIFPEQFVARQLAHRLAVPGLLEYLPLGSGIMVSQVTVDIWSGKTIKQLALPSKKGVQIVAVKQAGVQEFSFVPQADIVLSKGDILVLLGHGDIISEIIS